MSEAAVELAELRAATLRVPMPIPARIGAHVIAEREYTVVRALAPDGRDGWAYGLTRGAPLTAMVEQLVAPRYAGRSGPPPALLDGALRANPTVLCAGTGLRALSLADMAAWDLAARRAGMPLQRLLGDRGADPLPALLVVGFPPTMAIEEVAAEAAAMHAQGWRTFKLAIGPDVATTRARLEAAAAAGPEVRLVLDAVWTWRDADDAMRWVDAVADLPFAWIEDPFPPGGAEELARLRARMPVPLGSGDEQGGPGFPEMLLVAGALDVVRLDATAVGGVSGLLAAAARVAAGGAEVSCHVHGHLHAQALRGAGLAGWVEFGRPGSGVDPLGDLLVPEVRDGFVPPAALAGCEPPLDAERLAEVGCAPADVARALGELGVPV